MIEEEPIVALPGVDGGFAPSSVEEEPNEVVVDPFGEQNGFFPPDALVEGMGGGVRDAVASEIGEVEEGEEQTIDFDSCVEKYRDFFTKKLPNNTTEYPTLLKNASIELLEFIVSDLSTNPEMLWGSLSDDQYAIVVDASNQVDFNISERTVNRDRMVVEFFATRLFFAAYCESLNYTSFETLDGAEECSFMALSKYGDFFSGTRPDFERAEAQRSDIESDVGYGTSTTGEPIVYRTVSTFTISPLLTSKVGFAKAAGFIVVGESANFGPTIGSSFSLEKLYVFNPMLNAQTASDLRLFSNTYETAIKRLLELRDVEEFAAMQKNEGDENLDKMRARAKELDKEVGLARVQHEGDISHLEGLKRALVVENMQATINDSQVSKIVEKFDARMLKAKEDMALWIGLREEQLELALKIAVSEIATLSKRRDDAIYQDPRNVSKVLAWSNRISFAMKKWDEAKASLNEFLAEVDAGEDADEL